MPDQDHTIFDFVTSELRAEIGLFWQRSLFFWGLNAAAIIAYGALTAKEDRDLSLAVSFFGLVCSLTWTLANRGSKYWQVAWEQKLRSVEKAVLGSDIYSREERNTDRGWWGAARYSVTRLTIAMSDFTVFVWLALALKASPLAQMVPPNCFRIGMASVTLVFVVAILFAGRSKTSN